MLVFANDRAQLKNLLDDPAAQKQVIDDIYGFLQTRGFDGVNMDFEYVDSTQSAQYVRLIKNLKTRLGGAYSLSLSVPARTSDRETWYNGYDYAGLAAVADRVMVMAYDQHWKGGDPGPVAGNDWVESVINYLLPKIPNEKFQLGLGAYGYDWPTGANGKTILIQAARDLAKSKGITVIQDPASGVSTFNYTDDSGIQHQVWFEDTTSILAKLELVKKYDLKGIAIWRLGIIPDNTWQSMKSVIGN
jgi:spore germination protein YaaH